MKGRRMAAGTSAGRLLAPAIRTALRAAAILVYCFGAVIAPTLHQAFHHDDHIHVGNSIIFLPHHHDDDHDDADHDDADHDDADHDDADHDADHHHSHPHHAHDDEHGST